MIDQLIKNLLITNDKRDFWIKNKIFFFRELGYLLSWWVGLLESIEIINNNTSNFALKEITKDIKTNLTNWRSLAHSLTRQTDYFSSSDISIIKAWEKSWKIIETLSSLANEYQFLNKMYNQYTSALIYPITLIIIAISAVISLFAFVLPGIFEISDQFENIQLPWVTLTLRNISYFLVSNWAVLLWATIGLIFLLSIFFSSRTWNNTIFRALLQIPIIWNITQSYYLIKMSRYMKLMLNSWMNQIETFNILKEILTIPLYQDMINNIIKGLTKWQTIYHTLKYESELIPSSAAALLKAWEETAKMPETLDNIISIYDEDMQSNVNNLSKIIEPIMLVFIWWIIIIIALWVFWVITNIMDTIQI